MLGGTGEIKCEMMEGAAEEERNERDEEREHNQRRRGERGGMGGGEDRRAAIANRHVCKRGLVWKNVSAETSFPNPAWCPPGRPAMPRQPT